MGKKKGKKGGAPAGGDGSQDKQSEPKQEQAGPSGISQSEKKQEKPQSQQQKESGQQIPQEPKSEEPRELPTQPVQQQHKKSKGKKFVPVSQILQQVPSQGQHEVRQEQGDASGKRQQGQIQTHADQPSQPSRQQKKGKEQQPSGKKQKGSQQVQPQRDQTQPLQQRPEQAQQQWRQQPSEQGGQPQRRQQPPEQGQPPWRQQPQEQGSQPQRRQQPPQQGQPQRMQQPPEQGGQPQRRQQPPEQAQPQFRQQPPEHGSQPQRRQQPPGQGGQPQRWQQPPGQQQQIQRQQQGIPQAGAPWAPQSMPQQGQYPPPGMPQYAQPGIPQHTPTGMPQYAPPGMPQYDQPGMPQYDQPEVPQHAPPGMPQYARTGMPQYVTPGMPQYAPPGTPAPPQTTQLPPQATRPQPQEQQQMPPLRGTQVTHQGQRREKGGPKMQQPQKASPSTSSGSSEGTLIKQVSKIDISGKKEIGQGDALPMELIKAKPGIKGRKIQVETNHIPLRLGNLKTAIHYDVNLVPDTPKKYLRTVVELFRQRHFPKRYPAFDGRKNLYSAGLLPFDDFIADEVTLTEPDGREKKYKVEIKFANKVDLTPLHDLLKAKETPREALQVVDIVLRSAPAATCISVGRSFFVKPPRIIDLGEGMEMYNGFYQSAIRGWKPFLNVDVAHKAFPKSSPITDILIELFDSRYSAFTRDNLSRPLADQQRQSLEKFIKTLRVSYEIPGYAATRRVYRVNGIDRCPRERTFTLDSGEQLTIENYFARHKNYRLRYPLLPTLWVGKQDRQNPILLPLELCALVEGQVLNRKMTENQTSAMIRHAATSTNVRKDKIMSSLVQARHNQDPSVREFGFSVGNEFEKLEARVLVPPSLGYASDRAVKPAKGVWRGEKFYVGVTINKWTIACVDRRPPREEDISKMADMLYNNANSIGMTILAKAERPFVHIGGRQAVVDITKYFKQMKERAYDIIFVIVPNSGPQYSYVKTAAEINVGSLTQCIKSKTLFKMNPQTAINILLKVNSKLNGTNHILSTRPPILNRPCMIMGADVTHPSPDARGIPSVAAVTASHDPKAFRYNICWRLQPPKVEIIEDLEAITLEQLNFFHERTKVKPERIIFFRDGVSEGQFEQVRNAEIRAIRSACKKIQQDGYEPSITFLVVQKRHHTRLFPMNPRDSEDRNNNVPAGTCVDTTITHPFMQDFYLVSHASIQGVAKPTKYCTLWDDNNLSNDDIEELSYFLCHMFTRCNRSVSYPAPTYYAHLAAARAKVYIENENLNMEQLQREFSRFQIQKNIRKDLPMFFV